MPDNTTKTDLDDCRFDALHYSFLEGGQDLPDIGSVEWVELFQGKYPSGLRYGDKESGVGGGGGFESDRCRFERGAGEFCIRNGYFFLK